MTQSSLVARAITGSSPPTSSVTVPSLHIMSVSNSSIDPSFIFVGAEKPQVLKTTDTHFGNFPSISTPTFPIDSSSSSSAPSQLVTDHATSPVRLSLSCLEPTSPDQPLFRRPRLCRRLQFVIPSTTGLVVKLAEFALTNFVDMVWPCVTSVVSTSRSYIRCVVFALYCHTLLTLPYKARFLITWEDVEHEGPSLSFRLSTRKYAYRGITIYPTCPTSSPYSYC